MILYILQDCNIIRASYTYKNTPAFMLFGSLLYIHTHMCINKYSLRFICVWQCTYFTIFYDIISFFSYIYNCHRLWARAGYCWKQYVRVGLGFRCADHCWPSVPSRTFDTCVTLLPGALLLHFFYTACHPLYFCHRAPPSTLPPPFFSSGPSQLSPRDVVVFFSFFFPFLLCRGVALGKPHDCEKPEVNIIYIYTRGQKEMFKKNTHFITRQTN